MPPAAPPTNKWLVTVSISFGTLMGAIDVSIVNVALPHIQGALGATVQEVTWVSTGYAIALVILMPLTAFLGRLFGQKRLYMSCLVIFIAGSALCGTARTLGQLIAYRAIQGLGAGALQPTEQSILRQTFSAKEQGMAMAAFAMVVMLGPAVGPTLGGTIVDHWHWSWIFFINVPIGALGLFMVGSFVHDDPELRMKNQKLAEKERKHTDWAGIVLLTIALSSFEYVLEEGERNDWFASGVIAACALAAGLSTVAFVVRELTARAPVVNLRLFKDPAFASGTLMGAVMFAMLMANLFLLPIFMQEVLGFTATQAGFVLMPRVLVMMVATPIVGRLYNHVSPRLLVGIGVVAFSIGSYQMSHLTLESGSGDIVSAILIQGVGFGFLFVPLTTAALSRIPRERMTDATGMNSLFRQVGGAVGLAIFATLVDRYATVARTAVVVHTAPSRPIVAERLALFARGLASKGMPAHTARDAALRALDVDVQAQSTVLAFERVFLLSGLLFLILLPMLLFLKTGPARPGAALEA